MPPLINELSLEIEKAVLSCFPIGSKIVKAQSFRPGYLSYPMQVVVSVPKLGRQSCVVKIAKPELITHEAYVLGLLARLNFPVPLVLSKIIDLPASNGSMLLLSKLKGNALPWCGVHSLEVADATCEFIVQAVNSLHRLTDEVTALDTMNQIPQFTLASELQEVKSLSGEWMKVNTFRRAIDCLESKLGQVEDPHVFSNGDYNPLNFLYSGSSLTGFVDFENACFEHPLIGFVKFVVWSGDIYGWGTGKRVGLVERYLYSKNISRSEFAPIFILRSLRHLLRETNLTDSESDNSKSHILKLVEQELSFILSHGSTPWCRCT